MPSKSKRPASPRPHKPTERDRPRRQEAHQSPPPADQGSREGLARGVFQQVFEENAIPEQIVDRLSAQGLEPEEIDELLRAARGCIEYADHLPEDTDEFEADDLADFLIDDKGIDPELALDVIEAFMSPEGEEA